MFQICSERARAARGNREMGGRSIQCNLLYNGILTVIPPLNFINMLRNSSGGVRRVAFADARNNRGWLTSPWAMAALLFSLALLTRLIGIGDHPPRTDELFHILAGRSWAENGTLAMGDGEYLRARYYTMATGIMFELFGFGMAEGRALSAIGGALQVMALGLWMRSITGDLWAGWAAALLLCFNAEAIEQSQTARFYTWHALGTWLFAISSFALVTGAATAGKLRLAALLVVAIVSLAVAAHLQQTTAVVVAGVLAWTGLWLLINHKLDFIIRSPVRLKAVAAGLIVGAAAMSMAEWHQIHAQWVFFRRAPAWAGKSVTAPGFYLNELAFSMNWLFALFPLAAIIAWRRYRDATLFCIVIAAVILIVQSLGGMKATRYVYYAFPFIFALWGLTFAAAMPAIRQYGASLAPPLWPRPARVALVWGLATIVAGVALLSPNSYRDTARAGIRYLKTGSPDDLQETAGHHRDEVDWSPYVATLKSLTRRDVFIATDLQRTIFYLGDFDILLNQSELDDAGKDTGRAEFSWDDRSGHTDISRGSSLRLLMRCYATGSLLVSDQKMQSPDISPDAAKVIREEMQAIALPAALRMHAYTWTRTPEPGSPECKYLYDEGFIPEHSPHPD
jgi:hypothetical protein